MYQSTLSESINHITTSGISNILEKSNSDSNNKSKQSILTDYFTPFELARRSTPLRPKKPANLPRYQALCINLSGLFNSATQASLTTNLPNHHKEGRWRQLPLTHYFRLNPAIHPLSTPSIHTPAPEDLKNRKPMSIRKVLLNYGKPRRPLSKITQYTVQLPSYDLFESWGHSLDVIDPSTTLRVFLQNPHGLSIYNTNHFLVQDLQTCYNYGAGMLCLPETNTNWNQEGQVATIHQLFHRVWRNSSL
jgi:hypothetical protein